MASRCGPRTDLSGRRLRESIPPRHNRGVRAAPSLASSRGIPAGLILIALLAGACSDSGSVTTSTEAPRGRLDLVYFPDPAVGGRSPGGPGFVTWLELRIREAGGVGVRLARIQVGVSTDPASTLSLDSAEIVARTGSNRIEARGLLVLRVEIHYDVRDTLADIQVVIEGTDDLGNPVYYTGGLPIR